MKIISHPLYLHKLSLLRDERVRPKQFRDLIHELTLLLGVQATNSLDIVTTCSLNSPLGSYTGMELKDKIGIFPILRAGNGMVNAFVDLIPTARVHHLGLFREKVEFY